MIKAKSKLFKVLKSRLKYFLMYKLKTIVINMLFYKKVFLMNTRLLQKIICVFKVNNNSFGCLCMYLGTQDI